MHRERYQEEIYQNANSCCEFRILSLFFHYYNTSVMIILYFIIKKTTLFPLKKRLASVLDQNPQIKAGPGIAS